MTQKNSEQTFRFAIAHSGQVYLATKDGRSVSGAYVRTFAELANCSLRDARQRVGRGESLASLAVQMDFWGCYSTRKARNIAAAALKNRQALARQELAKPEESRAGWQERGEESRLSESSKSRQRVS